MDESIVSLLQSELEQAIEIQKRRMVDVARRFIPYIQYDDLMQPQDYAEIDSDPLFRFEEGTLYGLERALVIARMLSKKCSGEEK